VLDWAQAVFQDLADRRAALFDLRDTQHIDIFFRESHTLADRPVVFVVGPRSPMPAVERKITAAGSSRLLFVPKARNREAWLFPSYAGFETRNAPTIAPEWDDAADYAYYIRRRIAFHIRRLLEEAVAKIDIDLEKLSAWLDEHDLDLAAQSDGDPATLRKMDDAIAAFATNVVKKAIEVKSASGIAVDGAIKVDPSRTVGGQVPNIVEQVVTARIRLPRDGEETPRLSTSVYNMRYERYQDERTTHRLWVEGPTDKAILEIGAHHFRQHYDSDILDGFEIVSAGEGREGGTTALTARVRAAQICRDWDIVLIDDDPDGRKLAGELRNLGIRTISIPREIIPMYLDDKVEMEDLIPIAMRDQFYMLNPLSRPEREILYFGRDDGHVDARRLILHGLDKQAFVDWLKTASAYPDLEGVINLLHEIRQRFGLPALTAAPGNRRDWVPQFQKRNIGGLRKQPWLAFEP
jgi:hypothetical protein